MSVGIPSEEEVRLAALRAWAILGTSAEAAFDELAKLAASLCGTAHASISLIDREREWFSAQAGREERPSPRHGAIGEAALRQHGTLVVTDAAQDPRFRDGATGADVASPRFHACRALRTRMGVQLGTFCVSDPAPRPEGLTEAQELALETLAREVETQLELRLGLLAMGRREGELTAQRSALLRQKLAQERVALSVTHDLKSPLTALVLGTRLLSREAALSPAGRDVVRELEEAAGEMQRKLLDLVDVERAAHANLLIDANEIDLAQAAAAACRSMERKARARLQQLRLQGGAATARGDYGLAVRVLQNLIDNALRHSPAGAEVVVETLQLEPGVAVRVRDRGPPLPASLRSRMFDVDAPDEGGRQTTGIGLLFSRVAVETMGGRVWAEDGGGQGASLCLWLPGP